MQLEGVVMRGQRLREGIKRARKVLQVWAARRRPQDAEFYAPGGWMEHRMRFTRKPCSCPTCNRGRSVRGPTLQERRIEAEFQDELDAWDQLSDEDWYATVEAVLDSASPSIEPPPLSSFSLLSQPGGGLGNRSPVGRV